MALDEAVPVLVELPELELVVLGDSVLEGVWVLVPVTEGTSTTGSETVSEAARSTGFTPVDEL